MNADRVIGQSDVRIRAEGDVVVEHSNQMLNAQWIDYNQPQDTVQAGNRFTLKNSFLPSTSNSLIGVATFTNPE